MMSSNSILATLFTATLLLAAPAGADSLESAGSDLCEKVKTCALAEIDKQDLTPEMKAMMEPMLENMCEGMRQGMDEVPVDHELYDPAVACMRSMAKLSCADFQDDNDVQTPECDRYEKMATQMYGQE